MLSHVGDERSVPRPMFSEYNLDQHVGNQNQSAQAVGIFFRPEVVGEGGFGQVSRARHRRTQEVVAIKTISKSKLGDEEALQLEVVVVSDGQQVVFSCRLALLKHVEP